MMNSFLLGPSDISWIFKINVLNEVRRILALLTAFDGCTGTVGGTLVVYDQMTTCRVGQKSKLLYCDRYFKG